MIQCLDIHTHHPAPQPLAVVNISIHEFNPIEGQLYSMGIHPWESNISVSKEDWEKLENIAALPCVAAIGECGIDKLKGALLYKQMIIFQKHIELSEKLCKPLIIHNVKANDIIVGLKRELKPKQNWVIHGFRGKPTLVKMFTDAGIFLSFGEKFNQESLQSIPPEYILAETDESSFSIEEIIDQLNVAAPRFGNLTEIIAANTKMFLYGS